MVSCDQKQQDETSQSAASVQEMEETNDDMKEGIAEEEAVAEEEEQAEEKEGEFNLEESYSHFYSDLSKIERFFVRNSVFRMFKLLEYKGREDLDELILHLNEGPTPDENIKITELDAKNGYIAFFTTEIDCRTTMVYWNGPNDVPYIGTSQECCQLFCDADLSFEVYGEEIGYEKLVDTVVVPELMMLYNMTPQGHLDGDGFDRTFKLPKEGKNILFQINDEQPIELKWENGKFMVEG